MKAREFEKRFDDGEDVSDLVDWSKALRPNAERKHLDLELPAPMMDALDRQAQLLGVTRQSLIESWIAERLG